MNAFRNPKYTERYEDAIFDLETALNTVPANTFRQNKDGHRFVIDNSGEVTPFDWFNARISLDFKVTITATGANITAVDNNGIVNGSSSFIKNFDVKVNGKKVYDCKNANQCVHIKNLLEYSKTYSETTASNEFFFLDSNSSAQAAGDDADYNTGFAVRKALLGLSSIVNTEIPLNRYSFFEILKNELLPNTRVELNFEIESDNNLIWLKGAGNCRVIITRMQLFIPRITFNSNGQSLYISQYLKPHKWTYLHENIERSNSSQQRVGAFKITSGISKPRHVFVFIINDAKLENQTKNPFLYDTFNLATDKDLVSCHLEVGNGNEYPEIHYTPKADLTRVFRDVLKYVHANNEYQESTLLGKANFSTLYPFLYFDLTKQKSDIKDGTTKLTFKYELTEATAAAYSIYALTLFEQDIELQQKDGKLLLRS